MADAPYHGKAFESEMRANDHDGSSPPLMKGVIVDYKSVSDDNIMAPEDRQELLVKALRELKVTSKPCMAVALAPPRDLGLLVEGQAYKDPEPLAERPAAAKVVVPATQLVDISNLSPSLGESVMRCNPAFPAYRWFQAANLLLYCERKTGGRVIPFPLQSERKGEDGEQLGALESTMYHALRVTKNEYIEYQRLLRDAVANDGLEKGFFHAAKFAYQVLFNRGAKEITDKVVGASVTNIVLMGRPRIRGPLVLNDQPDDWTEELRDRHYVFADD